MKNGGVLRKHKKKIFFFSFLVLLFVFIGGYVIYLNISSYEVETRVDTLKKYNSPFDTPIVGWLKVQGTNIDYPVVYNSSTFYVNLITKDDFVWTNVNNKEITNRVFIVGHNILNVSKNPIIGDENHSRFEQLMSYIYYDFVQDNKYIQYTINGKDYLYKIFSVSFVKNDTLEYGFNSYPKNKLKEYIDKSVDESYFKFDVDVDESDNIITLVTCTRMFGNTSEYTFKIDARMVRNGEKTSNYDVIEKDIYKEILNIMEGEKKNEKA